MPSFFNERLLPVISSVLDKFRARGEKDFFTIDVIREHTGHYIKDNCNTNDSINANYGKFLKENEKKLGIRQIGEEISRKDDNEQQTSCSKWEFI